MNRLWFHLTLTHTVLVIASIVLVSLVTSEALTLNLRRGAARQIAARSGLVQRIPELAAMLEQHGQMMGRRGLGMGPQLIIADRSGRIIYDWQGNEGRSLTAIERRLALALRQDGNLVGYVLPVSTSQLCDEFSVLLRAQRRTALLTGAVASLAALLISLLLSESVAAPLRGLVAGARELAHGNLSRRIEPRGPEETRQLAGAFNHMAAELGRAELARRDQTADIAHELRTPLAVLQGNLSAMLDGLYSPTHEEIAALYDEVLRLSRLVQDLGELAALDVRRPELELAPVAPARLLEQAVTLFQVAADEKGVSLTRVWPEVLPEVWADANRLGQVLNNLLSNALRYTPPGGQVEVGAGATGGKVELWVADSGEGIRADDLPRVFQRFWRAEGSRSRESGGSGLGLAIARQLVEAMAGSITAESAPGRGTRFRVILPVAP